MGGTIFTIGHSTRQISDFISLLIESSIEMVVDIRTIPRSRHNPQFEMESLKKSLVRRGIEYSHMPDLGGLRHPRKDSTNLGWRNESFRGFADYMESQKFANAVDRLIDMGKSTRISIMCAEAVPWRCHRRLVSDALVVKGVNILHIISSGKREEHRITSFAVISNGQVTYPEISPRLF